MGEIREAIMEDASFIAEIHTMQTVIRYCLNSSTQTLDADSRRRYLDEVRAYINENGGIVEMPQHVMLYLVKSVRTLFILGTYLRVGAFSLG